MIRFYDFDISDSHEKLVTLLTIGEGTGAPGMEMGMSGDGHHNEVHFYTISELDGSLTHISGITWNVGYMDTCDTLDIHGDYFYISCGYWLPNDDDGSLPLLAKFSLTTYLYEYTYYMGFDLN